MSVTVLDAIVIVVVLTSATLAMVRGFVREILSVAAWAAAAAAAFFFYEPIVPMVTPYVENGVVATIVAVTVIFFVALIIASYITMRISDFVIDSRIGGIDRIFGFLFGVVRGTLLLVVAILFFNFLVPQPPVWVTQSISRPILENIGQRVIAALPEDLEAAIQKYLRPSDDTGSNTQPPTNAVGSAAPGVANYGSGTRQGLDQLIENSGPSQQ